MKIDARTVSHTDEGFQTTIENLTKRIFGAKKKINFNDFIDLRSQIHEDLLHYEFFTFDVDENDTISLQDFLRSIIVCFEPSKHNLYLKQIKKVVKMMDRDDCNGRVSL